MRIEVFCDLIIPLTLYDDRWFYFLIVCSLSSFVELWVGRNIEDRGMMSNEIKIRFFSTSMQYSMYVRQYDSTHSPGADETLKVSTTLDDSGHWQHTTVIVPDKQTNLATLQHSLVVVVVVVVVVVEKQVILLLYHKSILFINPYSHYIILVDLNPFESRKRIASSS
jgi:hypothetical protein